MRAKSFTHASEKFHTFKTKVSLFKRKVSLFKTRVSLFQALTFYQKMFKSRATGEIRSLKWNNFHKLQLTRREPSSLLDKSKTTSIENLVFQCPNQHCIIKLYPQITRNQMKQLGKHSELIENHYLVGMNRSSIGVALGPQIVE